MTGVTIDHMVATMTFIAAILLFTGLFAQTMEAAIMYQQNRHIAIKAGDLLDSILLTPGYPYNWGETNDTLSCFGLQQPGAAGYTLSSFALMRLMSLSERVEYPRDSGKWYNNITLGPNGFLFLPVGDSIEYDTASRLMGVNGTYGFQLSITPIVEVSITEYQSNPLVLRIEVNGPGSSLSGATLEYYLYKANKKMELELFSGTAQTDSIGVGYLNLPLNGETDTYTILVYASLGGLIGLGRYTHFIFTQGDGVMPFVVDYAAGKVYLAHSWDVQDQGTPVPNYAYNATFYIMTETGSFQEWPIANSTGGLNYGSKNYAITTLPVGYSGFMLVTYENGGQVGMSIMPWGIGSIAVSTLFGDNPFGNVWTSTDLRQVSIDQLSYQARIICWSLQGYQIMNPTGWF